MSKTETKEPKAEKSIGVAYIAKQLGKAPNLVRIQLRNNKVKKSGKSYSWKSRAEADKVVKQLKAA